MSVGGEDFFRYLPVSERAVRWGLYVTGVGCSHVPPTGRHPAPVHPELYQFTWDKGRVLPEFQVIYLTRGAGLFESGPTGRREVAAGDVILLFPDVWHRYRPSRRTGWDSYWVSANGNHLHELLRQGFLAPQSPVLSVGPEDALLETYRRLVDRVRTRAADNPQLLSADVMEILARILAPGQPEQAQPATQPFAELVDDRIVAEAVRFIWNHSHRQMTVADVVSEFPASRRSLERRFHRALGRTILDEITRCRVERVKRLLDQTDLPMKRVAATVGFSSAQRMTKVFHRSEGVSPTAYRRRQREGH